MSLYLISLSEDMSAKGPALYSPFHSHPQTKYRTWCKWEENQCFQKCCNSNGSEDDILFKVRVQKWQLQLHLMSPQ